MRITTWCERCGGFGQVLYGVLSFVRVTCPACKGSGCALATVAHSGQDVLPHYTGGDEG